MADNVFHLHVYIIADAFGSFSNFAVSSSVTNITMTWGAPLDSMWYHVLYTNNATGISFYECTAESMVELAGLSPSTSVKVTITALTGCGAVAQMSGVQSTAAIRECECMNGVVPSSPS